MMTKILALLSLVAFVFVNAQEPGWPWPTAYDRPFTFQCPNGEVLNYLHSVHSNRREDREWSFNCERPPGSIRLGSCYWTGYANELDGLLNFQCNNNAIIAGIGSFHRNRQEDRRFRFRCCNTVGAVVHSCLNTPQINEYDRPLEYTVPSTRVLKGVVSIHHNRREDRIFWFNICKVQRT